MAKHTVMSPTSCMGLVGIDEGAYRKSFDFDLDSVAADAGSLDPGPYYLGAGKPHVPRFQMKEDCRIMMEGLDIKKTPLVMGSAGGSGGRPHVKWQLDIMDEVAREKGRTYKVAIIDTTLDKEYLKKRARKERIEGCQHDKVLTEEAIEESTEIVAQIGVEALIKALDLNPDIVLAGRANDNACFAAEPVRRGFDKGLALHLGKILECGSASGIPKPGSKIMRTPMIGIMDENSFVIEPATDDWYCTVRSISGHEFYERTHPQIQLEPGGTLDMSKSSKIQLDDRRVKIIGSSWIDDLESYKVKLEGARLVGYRCLFMTTARDPNFIANLDWVFNFTKNRIKDKFEPKGLSMGKDFHVIFRVFGRDSAMGPLEPVRDGMGHEVGIGMEIVAPTQDLAHEIAYFGKYGMVWCNYPNRTTISGNVAYTYSPSILTIEPAYELSVHHILPIPADQSLFPIRIVEVGKK